MEIFMRKILIVALALFTVSAFAGTNASKKARKANRKQAEAACLKEGKTAKKDLRSCVKMKLNKTSAAKPEVAPETEEEIN